MKKATVMTSSNVGIAIAIRRTMKLREILERKPGTLTKNLQNGTNCAIPILDDQQLTQNLLKPIV